MSDRHRPDPHPAFDHHLNPSQFPQYSPFDGAQVPPRQLPPISAPLEVTGPQQFYHQPPVTLYAPTSNYVTAGPSHQAALSTAPQQASFTRIAPNGDLRQGSNGRAGHLPETPTRHVVGSQGRRGILPSAAGRPQATTSSSNGQRSPPLHKNEDGKYPCPHCNRPYLHAKHLKRHLLRHTGVRPYTCALCEETFSRSDILKRHFQKCSVRRGNPTGENHLAHSRANRRRQKEKEQEDMAMTTAQPPMPQYSTAPSMENHIGLANFELHPSPPQQLATAVRQSEMRRVNSYSNRGSTSSLNMDYLSGHGTPESSITTSGAATPGGYPHDRSSLNSPADPNFHINQPNPRYSANYSNAHLQHVLGPYENWQAVNYGSQDDLSSVYHSGPTTPHQSMPKENYADFNLNGFDLTQRR